jgi:Predicted dehydrogenases and related proteins
MKELRLGIVGLGNMGRNHAAALQAGRVPRCRLTAVCDENPEKLKGYENVRTFTDSDGMISSGEIDAILVATPHYSHTTIGIAALKSGLHVLVEKPISVHKADCQRLIAAHKSKKQVFAAMFNQRTDSYYRKIRELVRDGALGEIRRVTWTITDWFRTEAYYASGGWRATWAGEGGGVLLNQCPHNLDLYQWIFGLPDKVRGFCHFGKYHDIEVEDDVTAYFEYKNGMTGVFITSTGEAPGANRLEISGENGRLVYEKGTLHFIRNEIPMSKFSRTTDELFGRPPVWNVEIPVQQKGEQHLGILKNFTNAILDGEKLIAPAAEGIHSVELGNAILLSSLENKTVDLPISASKFEARLKKLIATSRFKKKKVVKSVPVQDFSKSFGS